MIKRIVSSILILLNSSLRGAPPALAIRPGKGRRSNLLAFSAKLSEIASLPSVARKDAGKRIIAAILILLHIALITAPEVFAMSSASYSVNSSCLNAGVSPGNPSYYTKLLLHSDGANNSETFIDETAKTVTAIGNARMDTSNTKFGSSSADFDGNNSCLSLADSSDWDFGSGNFSIDFWIKVNSLASNQFIFGQANPGGNRGGTSFWLSISTDGAINFYPSNGSLPDYVLTTAAKLTVDSVFHHIAIVRSADVVYCYIDGLQDAAKLSLPASYTLIDVPYQFAVGRMGEYPVSCANCNIDEFRVSKGIARWTSNFTPPTAAYVYGQKDDVVVTNSANSSHIALATLGQPVTGASASTSYQLQGGFIYSIQSNPPVFNGLILNQKWQKNQSLVNAFNLDDFFSAQNPPLTYAVRYETPGHNITASIDPTTHKVSFSQGSGWYGTESVSFQAKDAEGNECWSNSVQLSVDGVLLDFIPDITANENDLIQITPRATSSNGSAITYSFTTPLDSTGKWQTDYNSDGVYTVTVTATDASPLKLSASQNVKITIKDVNRPPVLDHISDITANEGDVVVITPHAADPDGNTLTYYYSAPFDVTGKWITGFNDAGVYTVKVTVTDKIDSVSQDVKVTINNVNRPPVPKLTVSSNTVNPNENFTISLSAVDPDNDKMNYSLQVDSAVVQSGSLNSAVNLSYSFPKPGDHRITLTVSDVNPDSKSAAATTVINVIDPNLNRDSIQPMLGDFNGDALTDLGSHNTDTGSWDIGLSNKGSFSYTTNWLTGFGISKDWIPISGDFNADGYTDIGIYNNTTGECKIALNNKSGGFVDSGVWVKFSSASYDWQILTADFNNDGLTDLAVYNAKTGELRVALSNGAGFGSFVSKATGLTSSGDWQAMIADVNGDSLPDLVLFNKSTGEWRVALYTGSAFVDTGAWITNFAKDKQPLLADFNSDGTTDIGYWDSGSIKYAISTGSKFVDNGVFKDRLPTDKGDFVYIADFNGDGLSDIAFFDKTKSGIDAWYVILSTSKPSDLLVGIDNGTGGKINITYDYAARSDNALLPFPVYVVTKIAAVNMLPVDQPQESYTQTISYAGGWFDATEREFRGFKTATVCDPITGNYSQTTFHQGQLPEDGSLKGKIKKIEAYDGNGKLISRVENTWAVQTGGPLAGGIGFPYLASTKNTVNEENNLSVVTNDTFTYDAIGNVTDSVSQGDVSIQGDERKTHTDYNQPYDLGHNTAKLAQFLDADSKIVNQSSFEYDLKGNLTKQVVFVDGSSNDPATVFTYDYYGNVLTATDPLGRVTSTTYDDVVYSYPLSATNALNQTVATVYDYKLGVAISATDANGNTSQTTYDTFGRVIESNNALGDIVATVSYPDFNTKITTNAANIVTKEYIDGLGRKYLTKTQGENGNNLAWIVSETTFNNRGAIDSQSLPHYEDDTQISYTRYEYDIRGRVIKVKADFPGELKDAEVRTEYLSPLSGRVTDALGHKKDTIKDVWGRNIEIIEYTDTSDSVVGGSIYHTYYKYDIKDNLIEVIDAHHDTITIEYDSLGKKISMHDPDMGIWKYEYDKVGNLIKQTDAKNQVLTFEYDQLNRLKKKSSLRANGVSEAISEYFYDDVSKSNCIGRLSKVVDKSGSTEFFYDKLGREIKSTKTLIDPSNPLSSPSYTVERAYDASGRLTSLKYPDNETVAYLYDTNSGLLESVVGNSTYASNITYNAKAQMLNINYGNNTQTTYTYGQDLRLSNLLTSSSTAVLQNLHYNFDVNGNLIELTDNIIGSARKYEYDGLDRLTWARNIPTADGFGATHNFQYDAIGNMTYKSDIGPMTYGVGAGPHAVTKAGAYSYRYDANGNMIAGKNKTLEYDAENRLTRVNELGIITTFTYDGDGGRVKKETGSSGTTYIGSLFEKDSDGKTRKYIFAGPNRIATVESTGATYYTHTDHLGSSNIITDKTGSIAQHCEYAPYGSLTVNTGTDVAKHKFTGKELDNTGLYFYAWRYYDPELGRFTQPDTIVPNPSNPQDFNRYSYCNNNPINYTDPSGHSWFKNFLKRWGSTVLSVAAIVAAPFSGGASLALFLASSAMGGVQAYQQGQLGAWATGFAVSLALGGMVPTPNFGNLGMQVGVGALRGAAIGAISGGLASMVGGGSFGAGAGQGAIGGAAAGGLSSLIQSQQFGNAVKGNGFVSNADLRAQQVRIASMKASLGVDREAITSATRSVQAAESTSGAVQQLGTDLLQEIASGLQKAGERIAILGAAMQGVSDFGEGAAIAILQSGCPQTMELGETLLTASSIWDKASWGTIGIGLALYGVGKSMEYNSQQTSSQ